MDFLLCLAAGAFAPRGVGANRRPYRICLSLGIDACAATDEAATVASCSSALIQSAFPSRSPAGEIPSPALSPNALASASPFRPCGCAGRC
jgi:hypothetical protein